MKYQVGDILKYPGNGITWKIIRVENGKLKVKLIDRGTSNHEGNLGYEDSYSLPEWKRFKVISFNS